MNSNRVLALIPTVLILLMTTFVRADPGFRLTITSKGLDYVIETGIPILEQQLSNIDIPDISGSASSPIGTIDYELKNIKLSNLKIPTYSMKPGTSGLTIALSSVSVSGKADWHYKQKSWPGISDSGSVDISADGIAITISAVLGSDSSGHPTLKTTGCSFSIGGLHVTFHGGASWLYNLFSDNIADSLKSSLQGQLCSAATDAINKEANHALETLPIVEKVDDYSEVNYSLTKVPVFTSTYIETDHKGEFFLIAHPSEAPFTPNPLPPVNASDKMIYVWITEYLVNTAGFVYQESGILAYNITADQIPSSFPISLNTSSFKFLVPQLFNAYPNMLMQLNIISVKPPLVQISPQMVNLTLVGTLGVNVVYPNKTEVTAFVLAVTVYADAHVSIHADGTQEIVSGNCTLLKFDMSLASTSIGQFSLAPLQVTVNALINAFVLPQANKYTMRGITIPMFDGVSFVNPQLELGEGYILVNSDINYKPSYWSDYYY
ncbi:PREDICTED: bactericidal permeability-increasing protein-like isoform X1 [Amphimedon queenslandica]|uniref:Bactericidal permeability-increasing protein n=1 Tax=Amphimedon queenslandica TaxID=400682 RepID=A0A1X7UE02_AMPQE|nr:PREDICTED: bactericidal permeability-increasing protein-like isoform X1 [Amphimedon queenslandica]|eukprot:XP_019854891.1 PREDICTED: bactericidal permeability-increasing protein-like isoform X1 [Amphimedon queenslandica]